jgi:site-specific DNA recombinase
MYDEQEVDLKTLKYVMYLRKSTEDEGRQIRSIGDQEKDCKDLVKRLSLNVIDTIREEKSAKKPGHRPAFLDMLKRIRRKEFDAIIAWHPDRLSRNSIESGKILHMLDTDVIKDIRFVSHQFSNDANGKMLLGMLFVFSKHYSDDLSSKVKRGVRGNLRDYKSGGTPKHGYIRDNEGIYRIDGKNFVIIQRAWQMRANGENIQVICDFINEQGYQKFFKKEDKGHQIFVMTDSVLSNLFKDTFYYGELVQSDEVIDLVKAPVPFEPMIDRDTYFRTQEYGRTNQRTSKGRKPMLPLRYMVYCSVCEFDRPMQVGRSRGRDGVTRLYYRCLNSKCTREYGSRSIRGKLVFDEIDRVIKEKLESLPPVAYDKYIKEVKTYSTTAKTKIRADLTRAKATRNGYEERVIKLSTALDLIPNKTALKTITNQIGEATQEMNRLDQAIKKYEKDIEKATLPKIDRKEFESTISQLGAKLKAADVVQKDIIASNLFLNLHFDHQKMTHYSLKEPFASLVELSAIQLGGAGWI